MPPAASDDRCLFSQATFSVKNQDILNDDALHFKLARSVLKIASFEFANLKYFNSTFVNLKNARLVLNAKFTLSLIFICLQVMKKYLKLRKHAFKTSTSFSSL